MENTVTEERILDDLLQTFERSFGRIVLEATTIKRGMLNLKWRIRTDAGELLLKQYNKDRYRHHKSEALSFALSQQERLHRQGLACPRIWSHNGRILLESANRETFAVMEYCQGEHVRPGKINVRQIYELGRETGRMHRLLNDNTLGAAKQPQFIPPSREARLAHWRSVREEIEAAGKTELLVAVDVQMKATEDVHPAIFDSLRLGWAHRDLWVDNLLFNDERITSILDFDRLRYDYPQLDAARAVISCALDEALDRTLASAFMEGYKEEREVPEGYLTDSIQLLWYMEGPWWINAHMDQHSGPPARFAHEMNWLAHHHMHVSDLLGHL